MKPDCARNSRVTAARMLSRSVAPGGRRTSSGGDSHARAPSRPTSPCRARLGDGVRVAGGRASAESPTLPEVRRQGTDLVAGGRALPGLGLQLRARPALPDPELLRRSNGAPPAEGRRGHARGTAAGRQHAARVPRAGDVHEGTEAARPARTRGAREAARRGRAAPRLPRPHRQPGVARSARLVRRPSRAGPLGGSGPLLARSSADRPTLARRARLRAHQRARYSRCRWLVLRRDGRLQLHPADRPADRGPRSRRSRATLDPPAAAVDPRRTTAGI